MNSEKMVKNIILRHYDILAYADSYIELLEEFPCNSKIELARKEGEMIRLYKEEVVNARIEGRTKKEYYTDNKDIIYEKSRQYVENNKEKTKEWKDKWRAKNIEKIQSKHECACGGHYSQNHLARHKKTEKHQKYEKEENQN